MSRPKREWTEVRLLFPVAHLGAAGADKCIGKDEAKIVRSDQGFEFFQAHDDGNKTRAGVFVPDSMIRQASFVD